MRQFLWTAWAGAVLWWFSGCATGPLADNPALFFPDPSTPVENPVYLPQGPISYNAVFDKVIDVVSGYFEISDYNRYEGRIETFPRIAPGFEQPWRPGDPDFDQRLLATLQTIRHRATVLIQPADNGGFFIQVTVYKELEDLAQPVRATYGAAIFRTDPTVERQEVVVDPTRIEANWIPLGRDAKLEQVILQRLKRCM
jgi:hypothetical protein